MRIFLSATLALVAAEVYDVVVYGGVPGGVAAAVAAARNGAVDFYPFPSGKYKSASGKRSPRPTRFPTAA